MPHPNTALPLTDRFWMKVNKTDGCWLWTATVGEHGYGRFGVRGRLTAAHRFAWEMARGPVPDGMKVLHRCDQPRCVRADHLFLGTQSDNMLDMYAKGRGGVKGQRGSANHFARLAEPQVAEIRRLYATGEYSQARLGAMFGVCRATVGCITRGHTWTP